MRFNTNMNQIKKTLLNLFTVAAALYFNIYPSAGWGQIGHSTIAQVAQDHLTPEAERALDKYLDGLKLAIIASDADEYRSQWTVDLGFVPTNPDDARVKGHYFVKWRGKEHAIFSAS